MSQSLYESLRTAAREMLGSYGQAMTLTARTPGAYDPNTATATEVVMTYQVRGAVFDFTGIERQANTLIESGDRKVTLPDFEIAPRPGMTLTFGGHEWRIVGVKTSDPGGLAVKHDCHVRR